MNKEVKHPSRAADTFTASVNFDKQALIKSNGVQVYLPAPRTTNCWTTRVSYRSREWNY